MLHLIPTFKSIPFLQGPYRHYVLNFLWILIINLCLGLAVFHLRKLYQDFSGPDAATKAGPAGREEVKKNIITRPSENLMVFLYLLVVFGVRPRLCRDSAG